MDDDENREPGMTLGRLVAAERNARTSIDVAKQAMSLVSEQAGRIDKLGQEIAQMRQEIVQLRSDAARRAIGSGPTA